MIYPTTPLWKERSLRATLIATPILAAPIAPAAVFGVHVVLVVFIVLTSISGGYVFLFYAIWTLGVLIEGASSELLGDSWNVPPLYWPFGPRQKRIRQKRRIRELERKCGIRDPWPL